MAEKISTYQTPKGGEVVDTDWTNFQILGENEEQEREYDSSALKDAELVKKSTVKNATAEDAKDKIIKFRLEKFGKRGHLIGSLFKEEKSAA